MSTRNGNSGGEVLISGRDSLPVLIMTQRRVAIGHEHPPSLISGPDDFTAKPAG